jgi:hypothetical protein
MLRIVLLCLLFPFGGLAVSAQQEDMMASISLQLEHLVDHYVKETFLRHEFPKDVNDLRFIFGPKTVDSLAISHRQQEQLAEMKVIRKDKGLRLQTSYGNNFKGSLLEDDGTFYRWRANAGVDWSILEGGLVKRKQQYEQKRLEYEADQARELDQLRELSYRKSFDHIIYTFNKEKVQVIENRLNILDELESVVEKMYYLRYAHWEAVLDVKAKKAETELFLHNYLTYLNSIQLDAELRNRQITSLPIFAILFDKIEARGVDTTTQHLVLQKELEALEHQFHWSKDINLGAQLRYNYLDGGDIASYRARDFVSAGLSLSVPLPLSRSANQEWKKAKQQKFKTEFETYQKGLNNELLNHYYEYEYAHKQYLNFFYKKERLAVAIDRHIRKRNLADPDYSPMQVVDKLDELFSVDLELIDIQQKMYLKALRIFTLLDAKDILPYIDVKDYNEFVAQFTSSRTLFCSADDLKEYDTNFLIEFFKINGIQEVVVDGGQDATTYLQYAALLDAAVGLDLKIRFLVDPIKGSKSLAGDLASLIQLSLTPMIHFDLMSALTDPTNGEYQEVLETIAGYSGSFNISISVPISTDTTLLQLLNPHISKLHLFSTDSEQLLGRDQGIAREHQNEYGQRLNLVVNPQDFGSKMEMDQFTKQLSEQLGLTSIGISSMTTLVGLDKKTVGWHEERRF